MVASKDLLVSWFGYSFVVRHTSVSWVAMAPITCLLTIFLMTSIVPFRLSSELVPLRISSNNTKQRSPCKLSIICLRRLISAKKYEVLSDKESERRMETNTLRGCTFAAAAQTGAPVPASTILIPKLLRNVLFPDMLDPVRIMKFSLEKSMSLPILFSLFNKG